MTVTYSKESELIAFRHFPLTDYLPFSCNCKVFHALEADFSALARFHFETFMERSDFLSGLALLFQWNLLVFGHFSKRIFCGVFKKFPNLRGNCSVVFCSWFLCVECHVTLVMSNMSSCF